MANRPKKRLQKEMIHESPLKHVQPTENKKIIPRPIHASLSKLPEHDKSSFRKGQIAFPPAGSIYSSTNTYDAGPDFCRPTSAVMESGVKKFQFPLGVWLTPFGSNQVHSVKVVSPLRCQRCKAYINPYFRHEGASKTVVCNICGVRFGISEQTDKSNLYATEISTEGVIDFIVSDKFYHRKSLDVIKVVIAIQLSFPMIQTGLIGSIIESIKSSIESSQFQTNIRFGVIYFNDDGVTFIKPKSSNKLQSEETNQYVEYQVNTKIGTYCCPLSDKQFLYNPNDPTQKLKLLQLLSRVNQNAQDYYQNAKMINMSNYVCALKCINESFNNQTGRVVLFTFLDPRQAPCSLRIRNEQENKYPLKPLSNQYYDFTKELVTSRIGVDHYIFSKQVNISHEIATVSCLSSLTGGNVHLYAPYNHDNHSEHLYYSIYKNITKNYVFDVDYTCRVSNGLSIGQFLVADGSKEVRDIGTSMMDPSNSIAITFLHQEKIEDNGGAYLQYAMMYTTGNGQRRIRVINYRYLYHNPRYQLTERLEVIHQAADYAAFANILIRIYNSKLKTNDPLKVREELITRILSIMTQYRNQCSGLIKFNELPIHANLSTAICYIHSIMNSKMFMQSFKVTADFKMAQILKINTYGFYQFALRYYPQVYPLTLDIYDNEPLPGDYFENDEEIAIIPPNLALTRNEMKQDGVYLYNTSDYLIILVMPYAGEQLLIELFGTHDWNQIQENPFPQLETSHNIRVNNIIGQLRRRNTLYNGIYQPLLMRTPMKKGPFNDLLNSIFRDDYPELSYQLFLEYLHLNVQKKNAK